MKHSDDMMLLSEEHDNYVPEEDGDDGGQFILADFVH